MSQKKGFFGGRGGGEEGQSKEMKLSVTYLPTTNQGRICGEGRMLGERGEDVESLDCSLSIQSMGRSWHAKSFESGFLLGCILILVFWWPQGV